MSLQIDVAQDLIDITSYCVYFKGATNLYFTHYSCVVFILFNTGLCESAFSNNSFGKLVFYRSVEFDVIFINFITFAYLCLYRCQVICVFVLFYENSLFTS